jgi:hypothetical protein
MPLVISLEGVIPRNWRFIVSIIKKCFNLLLISFLLVSISIVYTNSAYSQLNLNKLKEDAEKVVPKKDSEKPKEITKDEADDIMLKAYYSIGPINNILNVRQGLYS